MKAIRFRKVTGGSMWIYQAILFNRVVLSVVKALRIDGGTGRWQVGISKKENQ